MTKTLALVGAQADFQDQVGANSPHWEHNILLRLPGSKKVPIDTLRSSGKTRLLRNRWIDLGKMYRIARAVRDSSFVLAQSEQSGYELAIALLLFDRRKQFCVIFHGQRWWEPRNRQLAKLVGRMPGGRFLCLSHVLGTLLQQEYGIQPEKVHITGFGVDQHFFQPTNSQVEPTIVSAGTASRDFKCLMQASAGLKASVKIAADSTWYREELNTAGMEIPENVHIFSAGNYLELRKLYASALFVVVPLIDVRYACGYAVIAEAMAMGKAVIVTRNGAPSDLVEDGVTGLYVPPGDVNALRQAMVRLLTDRDLTTRMGLAARKAVEEKFNLGAYTSRLMQAMGMSEESILS